MLTILSQKFKHYHRRTLPSCEDLYDERMSNLQVRALYHALQCEERHLPAIKDHEKRIAKALTDQMEVRTNLWEKMGY